MRAPKARAKFLKISEFRYLGKRWAKLLVIFLVNDLNDPKSLRLSPKKFNALTRITRKRVHSEENYRIYCAERETDTQKREVNFVECGYFCNSVETSKNVLKCNNKKTNQR